MSDISRRRQWYAKHLGYVPGERRRPELKDISGLPPELLTRIFRHLDAFDLIMCSLVCKRWHGLASDDYVWKSLYESARSKTPPADLPNKRSETLATNFKQLYLSNGVAMRAMYIRRIVEQVLSRARVKSDPRCFNPVNHAVLKRYPAEAVLTLLDSERRIRFLAARSLRPDSAAACLLLTYSMSDEAAATPLSRIHAARIDLRVPLYSVSELRRKGERGPFSVRPLLEMEIGEGKELEQADRSLRVLMAKDGQIMVADWKQGGGMAFVRATVRQSQLEAAFRSLYQERNEGSSSGASGSSKSTKKKVSTQKRPVSLENNTGSVEIRCGSEVIYFGSWRSFDFDAAGVAVAAEGSTMAEPLRSGGLCMPWKCGGLTGRVQRLLHCSACVKNFIHCPRGQDPLVLDINGFCELLPITERSKVDYDVGGDLLEAVLASDRGRLRIRLRLSGDSGDDEEEDRGLRRSSSGTRAFVVGVQFEL